MKINRSSIIPFFILAILGLLMGLWAGLFRLGWTIPIFPNSLPSQHGPLMVSGFLGTLIALERVAALQRRWMFAAPLFSGTGWIVSLATPGEWYGPLLITLGSFFALGILVVIVRRETKIYTFTMAVGVACWLVGNLFWLFGAPIFEVVGIWAAFLILTITGERLELSRVLRFKPWHYQIFTLAAVIFLAGTFLHIGFPSVGARVAGIGMLALAAWLMRFDIARRNMRHPAALTRFIAICLFSGYIWMGLSGIFNLVYGPQFAGLRYDAELHSIFVGFVFSMIFGHALIILPALTGISVPFHKIFYAPLILLHGSLLLRIGGDLFNQVGIRLWGGIINEVAVLGFLGVFVVSILQQRGKQPDPTQQFTARKIQR